MGIRSDANWATADPLSIPVRPKPSIHSLRMAPPLRPGSQPHWTRRYPRSPRFSSRNDSLRHAPRACGQNLTAQPPSPRRKGEPEGRLTPLCLNVEGFCPVVRLARCNPHPTIIRPTPTPESTSSSKSLKDRLANPLELRRECRCENLRILRFTLCNPISRQNLPIWNEISTGLEVMKKP